MLNSLFNTPFPTCYHTKIDRSKSKHLLCGEIKDAFAAFQQLRQKCATPSAPLKDLNGKLLSDRTSIAARWQEHFSTLLNGPIQSPSDALVSEAIASIPDPSIDICRPTTMETCLAVNKIKLGKKAPGVCGIYPEYIRHGGNDALHALHRIFTLVW